MFIAGIVIGPALAVAAADFAFKPGFLAARWIATSVIGLLLLIAFVPFLAIELKAGLIVGLPLGLLLVGTPLHVAPKEDAPGTG